MDRRRLLQRILRGEFNNVRFKDLTSLLDGLGFEHHRTKGSHQIYKHPATGAGINLQPDAGQAKPWQLRLLAQTINEHGMRLED